MTDSNQDIGDAQVAEVFGEAKKNWGWLVGLGVLFIILGIIGLGMSVSLTLVGVFFFGWLMIIGGIVQVIETFQVSGWKSVLWHVLIAIMYILAGAIMIYDPAGSAIALTLFIGIALLVTGLFRIIMAFQLRPDHVWSLVLVSGLMSMLLGILVMAKWPISGFWVIGMFIAIEMIVNGWTYVMLGLTAKRAGSISA